MVPQRALSPSESVRTEADSVSPTIDSLSSTADPPSSTVDPLSSACTDLVETAHAVLQVALAEPPRVTAGEILIGTALEFVMSVVILGIIGAIVLAIAPDFTADGVDYLHAEPAEAFLYGIVAYVVVIGATILLAITIVGLLVVIPGLIVVAILGFGATTVALIALGSWLRSAFGGGVATEYGTALVVGAGAWAAIDVVPVVGGIVTFVIGTMGFGYLALYLANGRFGRDYGSFGGSGPDDTPRTARDRYDPRRERDERVRPSEAGARDGNEIPHQGDDGRERGDGPDDRFRNLAALDAEREERPPTADDRVNESDDDRSTITDE